MKWGCPGFLKSCCSRFMLGSAVLLLFTLGSYYYATSQVYVVLLGGQELGLVEDARQLELFVDDLTEGLSELYGMNLELAEDIELLKEFRPEDTPNPELVQKRIRHQVSFNTTAFLIMVNGEPFVPVPSEETLQEIVDSLIHVYSTVDTDADILDVVLLEELDLEECIVSPDKLFSSEEVVALLKEDTGAETGQPVQMAATVMPIIRSSTVSRYSLDRDYTLNTDAEIEDFNGIAGQEESPNGNIKVRVKTVEEITVIEPIPFPVEEILDERMLISESEINVPGEDGEKSVVYQLTKENGIEIERILISEEVLLEPVTQVETKGTKQPPSVGTGQFVWPVQGEGIIYNGYSSRHRGVDIHIDSGTNVLAADSGIVTFSGFGSTQGNYLIIYHGAYWTLYLHNNKHFVSQGDRVSRGQVIATVGATGRAFGAHLHFEVRRDDGTGKWHSYYQHDAVDPMQFFNRR